MTRPSTAIVPGNVVPLFGHAKAEAPDLSARGYHVAYRGGGQDWCPGCGRQHWLVGRMYAECAFCSTAVPLNLTGGEQ